MLFCRELQTSWSTRGAGRNQTGQITAWGRRRVARRVPHQVTYLQGVARLWNQTTRVGSQGLLWRAPPVGVVKEYVVTTQGPLPPGAPFGWSTLLGWIPVGTRVSFCGWAARSEGAGAKILRHRGELTQLRLPSAREVWFSSRVTATVGSSSFSFLDLTSRGAGASWRRGWLPQVRGTAINPVDHPHGGGQGKTSGGRPGCTPWGRLTRGVPTRRKKLR